MLADNAARAAAAEARGARAALLGDDEVDRPVCPDLQHVVVAAQIGVGLAVLHIGPVTPDAGEDRLAARGMARDLARQGQQRQRLFERHVLGLQAARQRRALGLLAFALLHVVAEPAVAQGHLFAGLRVLAEHDARPAGRHWRLPRHSGPGRG